jgi:hypothetical protein
VLQLVKHFPWTLVILTQTVAAVRTSAFIVDDAHFGGNAAYTFYTHREHSLHEQFHVSHAHASRRGG